MVLVVDKVALGQNVPRVLRFSLASFIPQIFKFLSFIYQQKHVTLYRNKIIEEHEKIRELREGREGSN